jgi:3-carboxy-cis,cis-muconate cycloisomerase
MAARTLLQQAVPTTFGLKAAGWLAAVVRARRRLVGLWERGLAAQLGGAAGTLAVLGDAGPDVAAAFADELDLPDPGLPWHTDRARIAELGSALAIAAAACAKIGLDVALLEQTEVGEVHEPNGGGASSTMPQKRNPVGSTVAIACARRVESSAGLLSGSLDQQHERALGDWHAEWDALSEALACCGAAAAAIRVVLEGLQVDTARMRANLGLGGGTVMSESVLTRLAARHGRPTAAGMVAAASARALESGRSLRSELDAEPTGLTPEELDAACDPERYLGATQTFVDRALALYREGNHE